MTADGSSRVALVLTALLAVTPLYLLVTYRHCRGPGEGGARRRSSALVGAAAECVPTGPIAIVRAPTATLVAAAMVVAICYALSAVIVSSFRR